MHDQVESHNRILRFPEVHSRVRLSRSSISRLERDGTFPKRRRLSRNAVGWLSTEVDEWMATRESA